MIAYHVSNQSYAIGSIVHIPQGEDSSHYTNGNAQQKDTINYFDAYIDANYPDYIHRRRALFAFEKLEDAKQYCRASQSKYIYEVDFSLSYKGPFVLVDTMMKNLGNDAKCNAIAQEYFTPDLLVDNGQEWCTYELLGSSFKILSIINERSYFGFAYIPDREKSERLFGDPRKGTHGKIM